MGRLFEIELHGLFYRCKACSAHLASLDDLVSKHFYSHSGKAYLFDNVVNVSTGVLEDKTMLTGLHTIADIYCNKCNRVVGWKYEKSFNNSQKYKEGKFILERCKLKQGDANIFFNQPAAFQNNAFDSDVEV